MSDVSTARQAGIGVRMFYRLLGRPDLLSLSDEELVAMRDAQNRKASVRLFRVISGFPDRGSAIDWREVNLADREVPVRVYRPAREAPGGGLPLVVHVHGGGFAGTAVQCDWINAHLAARLPAVVVSVEHRLVSPGVPFSAAVDDGWDVLRHLVEHAGDWGVDPARVAVMGESAGAAIMAVAAIRAGAAGLGLRAQVLVNPCVDVTPGFLDYDSMAEFPDTPSLNVDRLKVFRRLAVPQGADARAVSPLYAGHLGGLAPALVVVPVLDPLADHGRDYAAKLRAAGTSARVSEHDRAGHAFLSMPHLVPQAKDARDRITDFLRERLG